MSFETPTTELYLETNHHAMSQSTPSSDGSYLTTIPDELLLDILPYLDLKTFFALTHTSHRLRVFVKQNAIELCNAMLKTKFYHDNHKFFEDSQATDSQALLSQDTSPKKNAVSSKEWSIPKCSIFAEGEKRNLQAQESWNESYAVKIPLKHRKSPSFSSYEYLEPDSQMKITAPGPQYVFFLEKERFHISCYIRMVRRTELKARSAKDSVVGTTLPCELQNAEGWVLEWALKPFLNGLQKSMGKTDEGRKSRKKELIWFYGA